MRLPFVLVPRAAYEAGVLVPRDLYAQLLAEKAELFAECRAQRDTITRMKLSGGALVALAGGGPEARALAPRERSPFELAADENPRTKSNVQLRAKVLRWADDEMRGVAPEHREAKEREICDELRSWNRVTEEDDEDDAL